MIDPTTLRNHGVSPADLENRAPDVRSAALRARLEQVVSLLDRGKPALARDIAQRALDSCLEAER